MEETPQAVQPAPAADGAMPDAAPQPEQAPQQPAPQGPGSAREAFERAFQTLDEREGVGEQPRDERGRFAQQDAAAQPPQPQDEQAEQQAEQPATRFEPPPRFSADAKQAWEQTPEPVRAEVNRAVREMESGLQRYQEAFRPLKPYFDMAQQHGREVHDVLNQYVTLEKTLNENPLQGFDAIARYVGMDLPTMHQVIGQALGQQQGGEPQQGQGQQVQGQQPIPPQVQQYIGQLEKKLGALEKQVSGVTSTLSQQQEAQITQQVEEFAQTNPRLSEPDVARHVADMLETGYAPDLQTAYDYAVRLVPEATPSQPSPAPEPEPETEPQRPQTPPGGYSISGAPAAGSTPAGAQRPSRKPRDAVANAVNRVFA